MKFIKDYEITFYKNEKSRGRKKVITAEDFVELYNNLLQEAFNGNLFKQSRVLWHYFFMFAEKIIYSDSEVVYTDRYQPDIITNGCKTGFKIVIKDLGTREID